MPDKIDIRVSWDSGPYAVYGRDVGVEWGESARVPTEIFERYELAEAELSRATDALEEAIKGENAMAINYDSKPCNRELVRGINRIQGTAAPEPNQGTRTSNSGTGTASAQNSMYRASPFGTAKEEPNQGARTPDSGAGGCNSLAGRGTMEQK